MTVLRVGVLAIGAVVGFVASRTLRRPANTGAAGSLVRTMSASLGRRKGLSLPELQRATLSEMMRHVRAGPSGRPAVPSRFVVRLHPADLAAVQEAPRWFVTGLADSLAHAAADHGWDVTGPIDVALEGDAGRHQGAPTVLAVPLDAPGADPTPSPAVAATVPAAGAASVGRPDPGAPAPQRAFRLRRLDTGQPVELRSDEVSIGRGTDQMVVLDDSRISRHHATVQRHGTGWVVTDHGSSNGTRLNGQPLAARRPTTLRPGDTLDIGPLGLRFEADARGGLAAGERERVGERTVTLDAVTRERISAEYLIEPAPPRSEGAGAAPPPESPERRR